MAGDDEKEAAREAIAASVQAAQLARVALIVAAMALALAILGLFLPL
jgi:hypothetical protein